MTDKHRMRMVPEWRAWKSMRNRCFNANSTDYPRYGGRGITVCDRWCESFEAFFADMGPRPDGTTLERVDNSGNYEPGNCRWATSVEQARNRRTNRLIEFQGDTLPLVTWAERQGLPRRALRKRLEDGWPIERALFESRLASREAKPQCGRGHELDEANTYSVTRSDRLGLSRRCRACDALAARERRARRLAV